MKLTSKLKALLIGVLSVISISCFAVPVLAEGTSGGETLTIEQVKQTAVVNYEFTGLDRFFDGTKTIDKTEDLSKLTALSSGSLIFRAKWNGESITNNSFVILGMGDGVKDNKNSIQFSAIYDKDRLLGRPEFINGMYLWTTSDTQKAVDFADKNWHTIVYTNDNGRYILTADGKTYANNVNANIAKFFSAYQTGSNDKFLIGGTKTQGGSTAANQPFTNWVGEIDYITVTATPLTQEQGEAISSAVVVEETPAVEISLDNVLAENVSVGTTVGNVSVTGESGTYTPILVQGGDNFELVNGVLKIKTQLVAWKDYKITIGVEEDANVLKQFTVSAKGEYSPAYLESEGVLSFDGSIGKTVDWSNQISGLKQSSSFSFALRFMQNTATASTQQTLMSVSCTDEEFGYFQLYVKDGKLCYEIKYGGGVSYKHEADCLRVGGVNSVAFVSNSANRTLSLFANGKLVYKHNVPTNSNFYDFSNSGSGVGDANGSGCGMYSNSIRVGMTDRKTGDEYLFNGVMTDVKLYDKALNDQEAIKFTAETPAEFKLPTYTQPFVYQDPNGFKSYRYRIPALITLNNGNVLAGADLRANLSDSPNNIEIGVRVLDKTTNLWSEPIIPLTFVDYQYNAGSSASASFIDTSLGQGADGRIHMVTDAMPAYAGGGVGGAVLNGTIEIGGKVYYILTDGDPTSDNINDYGYYIYPNENATGDTDKYIVKKIADNSSTEYTLDGKFNIYKNGSPVMIDQRKEGNVSNGNRVVTNIFYDDSPLKLHRTTYFVYNYSDDGGYTWSDPVLMGSEFRQVGWTMYNNNPGTNLVIKNGPHAGRILVPIYAGVVAEGRMSVITLYSDDNGATWKAGEPTTLENEADKFSSECQYLELPDGTIRVYARNRAKYIGYADSIDGGVTFEPVKKDMTLKYCMDCFISAIRYEGKIDGKDAIVVSYPIGNNDPGDSDRFDGAIRVGFLVEDTSIEGLAYGKWSVDWQEQYLLPPSPFQYSCLTTLANGDVALLHEQDDGTGDDSDRKLYYTEFTINELLGREDEEIPSVTATWEMISNQQNKVTISITLSESVFEPFSNLANVSVKGVAENQADMMFIFKELSADGKTLYFEGMINHLALSEYEITFTLQGKENIVILSGELPNGVVNAFSQTVAVAHNLENQNGLDATCTENGYTAHSKCEDCGLEVGKQTIPAGHDLEHHPAKEPTTESVGWKEYDSCKNCDYTTYVEIPKLEKSPVLGMVLCGVGGAVFGAVASLGGYFLVKKLKTKKED